jgi:hypothetical protein
MSAFKIIDDSELYQAANYERASNAAHEKN